MSLHQFSETYRRLTGHRPLPWQETLYERLIRERDDFPTNVSVPTGLGKTSIIAIWLIGLACRPTSIPRRLVYVVNRRTVVDQTTTEVEKLRTNLETSGLMEPLRRLCALPETERIPLAISTLRGQFADNREWSADPARPAVIIGTVDMIGSRLLFIGYGVGFKGRPLHAGFLGQDVLLIHDEAHLEPAFQELMQAIQREQERCREFRPFRVIALTATTRNGGNHETRFGLTDLEKHPPARIPDPPEEPLHVVWRRLKAPKKIIFHNLESEKEQLPGRILDLCLDNRFVESGRAILIFVRSVENAEKTVARLRKEKQNVQQLTGTMRGFERDRLPMDSVFARFMPTGDYSQEVGLHQCGRSRRKSLGRSPNLRSHHLDSMAQRFGRVNRFGDCADTEIHIVHPTSFNRDDEYERKRQETLALLQHLNGNGSPLALANIDPDRQTAAFAPAPTILPVSDILFDTWSMTTIHRELPGCPVVEPYLRGSEQEFPETYVAWRKEVSLPAHLLESYRHSREDLFEDYPLKPHELLRDRSDRVAKHLIAICKRAGKSLPSWTLDQRGYIKQLTIADFTERELKERIQHCTVLLPPESGGLDDNGSLDGLSPKANDVADEWRDEDGNACRLRRWSDKPNPEPVDGMRLVREIDTQPDADEDMERAAEELRDEGLGARRGRYWRWYVRPRSADDEGSTTALVPIPLNAHTNQVGAYAKKIAAALDLPADMQVALELSGRFHDLGKRRELWQRSIGNPNPTDWHAKSGRRWKPLDITSYRHELGSLLDVQNEIEFRGLNDDGGDLVLHLIAAHHGRARPHFPSDEIFDPDPNHSEALIERIAIEVPRRFARLQRRYGRWGLAYLESLLRAADWAASNKPMALAAGES